MGKNSWKTFGHLLARLIGLTGLVVAIAGLVIWHEADEELGQMLTYIGGGMAAFGLLVELIAVVALLLSRRGAMGSNVLVQVLIATLLLAGVNVFSFLHYQRFDWTRNREFTLDDKLRAELSKLRGETTIVVFQRHGSLGQQGKPDHYDAAADRKIVEKVRDLVEQFSELGPRFRVRYLDIDDENYQEKLAEVKRESPALGEAIENAPENSIFFFSHTPGGAGERIQRLAFHDIYHLDKQASQEADGGRGNLVLKYQGAGPFARKILNIEEKKPRIAVAAVYDTDGLDSPPPWGMSGAKKSLAMHGFDSRDIILKREGYTVLTAEEHKYESLEAKIEALDADIAEEREDLKNLTAAYKDFQGTVAEVNKKYGTIRVPTPVIVGDVIMQRLVERVLPRAYIAEVRKENPRIPVGDVSDTLRKETLELVKRDVEELGLVLKKDEERRAERLAEKAALNAEDLAEKRRIADLRAKFNRMLADCDLVIVPRLTLVNVATRDNFRYDTYKLDDAQVEALKDALKAGKPMLFCLSPPFDDKDGAGDAIDKLLADLGVRLAKETVLYDLDAEALAEQRANPASRRAQGEAPPAQVEWSAGAGLPRSQAKHARDLRHPLRSSLRLGARVGKDQPFDLRLRHPRPVYVVTYYIPPELPGDAVASLVGVLGGAGSGQALAVVASRGIEKVDESAIILLSGRADSWNEEQPLPQGNRIPKFKRPKADDPNIGTLKERRRGPFPVAVALETKPPAAWYANPACVEPPTLRVAVIGHGGAFIGATLTPGQEKLLLDTCNWLLGREDLLARDEQAWQYPRVQLAASESALWTWGARLGLPLIFAYFGMVMLLVRRMR